MTQDSLSNIEERYREKKAEQQRKKEFEKKAPGGPAQEPGAKFQRLAGRDIALKRDVFVKPKDYPEIIGDSSKRIYVVTGKSVDGTTTVAVNLALQLLSYDFEAARLEEERVLVYKQGVSRKVKRLNDVISDRHFAANSVCIVKDFLELGIRRDDLDESNAEIYQQDLNTRKSYLILTASSETWRAFPYPHYRVEQVDLDGVFTRHLAFFQDSLLEEDRALLDELRLTILSSVASASQIGEIFARLPEQSPLTREKLDSILSEVTNRDQMQPNWFNDLRFNERLFAMLVAIVQNSRLADVLDIYNLEELYYTLIAKLRSSSGMDNEQAFIDPRRIGITDMIEKLGLTDTTDNETRVLRFKSDFVRDRVTSQVANYHRLLWVMADVLQDILEGKHERWPFDSAPFVLASLSGQVGVYRPQRLGEFVDKLAEDPYTTQFAALTLEAVAKSRPHRELVVQFLQDWVPGKHPRGWRVFNDPNKYKAAAETIALAYDSVHQAAADESRTAKLVLERLSGFLTTLAEHCGSFPEALANLSRESRQALEDDVRKFCEDEEIFEHDENGEIVHDENDQPVLDKELHQLLIQTGTEVLERDLVDQVIEWADDSLQTLLGALEEIGRAHLKEATDLIIGWIERGLENARQNPQEQEEERQLQEILKELTLDELEREAAQNTEFTLPPEVAYAVTELLWQVGLAAAKFLFLSTSQREQFQTRVQAKPAPAGPEKAAVLPEGKQEGATPPVAEPEKAEPQAALPAGETPSADESGQPGKDKPQDESADKPKERETATTTNWSTVEEFLRYLLRLLPVMLRSSVYETSVQLFLQDAAKESVAHEVYGNPDVRHFDSNMELLLNESPIEIAMFAIRQWYEAIYHIPEAKASWIKAVYPALLQLVNDASQGTRPRFREALFNQGWVDSLHPELTQIAHALLARTYVMDGSVMDLPLERYGMVVLDASRAPWGKDFGTNLRYRDLAFNLIQRLSVLTPLRIDFLGAVRETRTLAGSANGHSLTSRQLRLLRPRSRLLMPIFDPPEDTPERIDPRRCHFVLLFTLAEQVDPRLEGWSFTGPAGIIDLPDLLDAAGLALSVEAPQEQWDPFAMPGEKPQGESAVQHWEWENKFFVLTNERQRFLDEMNAALGKLMRQGQPVRFSYDVQRIMTVLEVQQEGFGADDLNRIEAFLRNQIALILHDLPAAAWEAELARTLEMQNRYTALSQTAEIAMLPKIDLANLLPVREQLGRWVGELDNVARAQHPRDITLTIAWTILTISRFEPKGLEAAVDIVRDWLESNDRLSQRMGVAATKLLFNFYRVIDVSEQIDRYGVLLDLVRPFVSLQGGYAEFDPLLTVLIRLAYHPTWSERLIGGENAESEFLEAIASLSLPEDIRYVLDMVQYHVVQLGMAVAYAKLNLKWDVFWSLLIEIGQWIDETSPAQRQDKQEILGRLRPLLPPEAQISAGQVTEIENLCATEIFARANLSILGYVLSESRSLTPRNLSKYEGMYTSVQRVAESVYLALSDKMDEVEVMPRLTGNSRYGVLFVEILPDSDLMVKSALAFMRYFRKVAQKEKIDPVVLTVHRIGRTRLLYSGQQGEPKRRDLKPEGLRARANLIGPTLERYPFDQTGFVLIMTTNEVRDLDDWADSPELRSRFWVHTTNRTWSLDVGIDVNLVNRSYNKGIIEELTEEIIKKVL